MPVNWKKNNLVGIKSLDTEAELEFGVSLNGLLYLGGWNGVRRMRGNDNSMGDS